jgi:hypothetical protein
MPIYTIQCGFADYNGNTVVVEAETVEEACRKAIEEANDSSAWKRLDDCGGTYVDAIVEGESDSAWAGPQVPVPVGFRDVDNHLSVVERHADKLYAALRAYYLICSREDSIPAALDREAKAILDAIAQEKAEAAETGALTNG